MCQPFKKFSKSQVDAAGKVLKSVEPGQSTDAVEIIGQWRAMHVLPLETFYSALQRVTEAVFNKGIVVRRLKRMESIRTKLTRGSLRLSQMQDIVGCRAIVRTVQEVYAVVKVLEENDWEHELEAKIDYIARPRESGYRGVHMIFKYCGTEQGCNGLYAELQIRTRLQHLWSTTVETVALLTKQNLKAGDGSSEWLRFFAVVSTMYAAGEKCTRVPGAPIAAKDIAGEIAYYGQRLEIATKFSIFNSIINIKTQGIDVDLSNVRHFLLMLEKGTSNVKIDVYTDAEIDQANRDYIEAEKLDMADPKFDTVLVSAESLDSVRNAFPNYFNFSIKFLETLELNSVIHFLGNKQYLYLSDAE